jgi:hypothetical protein
MYVLFLEGVDYMFLVIARLQPDNQYIHIQASLIYNEILKIPFCFIEGNKYILSILYRSTIQMLYILI